MKKLHAILLLSSLIPLSVFGQNDVPYDDIDSDRIIDPEIPYEEDDIEADRIYSPDSTSADIHPVGSPQGEFSVSATGGATYSIHIACPKGVNGMTPDVSLVYDSQGGNNVAGWGFGLSCMSSIRFVGRDIYHDGVAKGIDYDWTDGLSLDGKRLILQSGTAGVAEAIYTLEGDPFTKATLKTDTSSNKFYFLVETPDGMRYEYGRFNSLQTMYIHGNEHYVAWYLYKYYDRHWNSVAFGYYDNDNCKYLSTIAYGDDRIQINYQDRNDEQTYYLGDAPCHAHRRIYRITTKRGDNIYRIYDLAYDTTSDQSGTKYSRLTSVTESNGNGESLKPITINWNYLPGFGMSCSNMVFSVTPPTGVDLINKSFVATDVNNDGISDILAFYDQESGYLRKHIYVFLSQVGENGTVSYLPPKQFDSEPDFNFGDSRCCTNSMSTDDFDGDGKNDVLWQRSYKDSSNNFKHVCYHILKAKTILNNTSASIGPSYVFQYTSDKDTPIYTTGDFNSDGKTEILQVEPFKTNGKYGCCYMFYSDTVVTNKTAVSNYFYELPFNIDLPSKPPKIASGDFNNDGALDVVIFCNEGYKVLFNMCQNTSSCQFGDSLTYVGTDIDYRERMIPGDYNGDGLTDFVINGKESSNYYLLTCNGDGSFTQSDSFQLGLFDQATGRDDNRFTVFAADFDHDNRTDLFLGKAVFEYHGFPNYYNEFVRNEYRWFSSTGTGFSLMRVSQCDGLNNSMPSRIVMGDFTGNGQFEISNCGNNMYLTTMSLSMPDNSDVLSVDEIEQAFYQKMEESNEEIVDMGFLCDEGNEEYISEKTTTASPDSRSVAMDETFHLYKHISMNAGSGKVKTLMDGYNNLTNIYYASMSNSGIYDKGNDALYPIIDLNNSMSVVDATRSTNGVADTLYRCYHYGSLKYHVSGKGLLGFEMMSSTDTISGITNTNVINSRDNHTFDPTSVSYETTVDNTSKTNVTTYDVVTTGNNYKIYVSEKLYSDIYGNETTTTYTYDTAKGVPTVEHTVYDNNNQMCKTRTYNSYTLHGGAYRPISWTESWKHKDDTQVCSITTTASYNIYGEIVSQTEHAGTQLARTSTFTYDTYGNLLTKTVPTTADSCMTTVNTYLDGRLLASKSTNPATTVHTYTYDAWGNMLSDTETINDTLHLTSTYAYDGWDRPLRAVNPDGLVTKYKYGWGSTAFKKYYALTIPQGAPWTKTWFDSRGRKVLEESVGPDHLRHDTSIGYDGCGREIVHNETLGLSNTVDSVFYDALGRVTEKHSTGCGRTTFSYASRKVTETTAGRTTVTETNEWGDVKKVTENGVEAVFTYSSNGKPKSITSNGHTITMTYDLACNLDTLSDPDSGVSTWTYDRCGNVVSHRDARGFQTTNSYFATGKLKSSLVDGTNHWYSYDANGRLLTERISRYKRQYMYDQYGRMTYSGRWTPSDGTVANRFYYDSLGRVRQTTRTHGPTIYTTYDENGFKTMEKAGNKTLWRLEWTNGEKYKYMTLSDSLQMVKKYDSTRRLTRSVTRIPAQYPLIETRLDSCTYQYDASTGNLLKQKVMTNAFPERMRQITYTYDGLDRLTKSKTVTYNSADSLMVTYGSDGNITSKTGIGAYTYGGSKPHAVTQVANTGGLISNDNQQISYNAYGMAVGIVEGPYSYEIQYGPDRQRWKTILTEDDGQNNTVTLRTVRYHDDMDIIAQGDSVYSLTYLDGGILAVKNLTSGSYIRYYQTCADLLGSVTKILRGDGTEMYKTTYDSWGRQTVTKDDIGYIRGYTGHEMLPEFGLVNMNGRMYDPLLGRFLSPDPYVQMPLSPQNYNRYSYCLNNPMKYVDPSGEIFGMRDLIISAFGFMSGYLVNSLHSGNWGWKSVKSGLMSAASALIGYYMPGGGAASSTSIWKNMASVGFNELAGYCFPKKNVAIGNRFSMSFSPLFGFGDGGLSAGIGLSATYRNGDYQLSLGAGAGNSYKSLSLSVSGKKWGFGYTYTYYPASNFYGNNIGSQTVGTISVSHDNWNFNFGNDFLAASGDKWRSTAAELIIGDFSIGTLVGTNDGSQASQMITPDGEDSFLPATGPISGNFYKWRDGRVYMSPLWIGFRMGNQITRYGFSHKYIQDATQNVLHRIMNGAAKYYMDYNELYYGFYSYRGAYNPFSLWNH